MYALFFFLQFGLFRGMDELSPILEGGNYTIKCAGQTTGQERTVYWSLQPLGESPFQIACCFETCHINGTNYKGSYVPNGNLFTSQLTIINVSARERQASVRCEVMDYRSQGTTLVSLWSVSTVYKPPLSLYCKHKVLSPKTIEVCCHVEHFYPDVVCQMNVSINDQAKADIINLKNGDNVLVTADYSTNCSTDFLLSEPGVYEFDITVYPLVTRRIVCSAPLCYSFKIHFTCNETVVILTQKETTGCWEEILLECKAFSPSLGTPNFKWHLDNATTSYKITKTINQSTEESYIYSSELRLSHAVVSEQIMVMCAFSLGNLSNNITYSNTKYLMTNAHITVVPYFRRSTGKNSLLENNVYINTGEHDTFVCETKEKDKVIMSLSVECKTSDGIRFTFSENTSSVVFKVNFYNHLQCILCTCSVDDATKCYNSSTNMITFLFNATTGMNKQDEQLPMRTMAMWTGVGVLGLTASVLVTVVLVYNINKCTVLSEHSRRALDTHHVYEYI